MQPCNIWHYNKYTTPFYPISLCHFYLLHVFAKTITVQLNPNSLKILGKHS